MDSAKVGSTKSLHELNQSGIEKLASSLHPRESGPDHQELRLRTGAIIFHNNAARSKENTHVSRCRGDSRNRFALGEMNANCVGKGSPNGDVIYPRKQRNAPGNSTKGNCQQGLSTSKIGRLSYLRSRDPLIS